MVNGARPPSANDMFPLLCSALFGPLIQPLCKVDRTSDLEVDVVPIRLVYGRERNRIFLSPEMYGLSSPLISKV